MTDVSFPELIQFIRPHSLSSLLRKCIGAGTTFARACKRRVHAVCTPIFCPGMVEFCRLLLLELLASLCHVVLDFLISFFLALSFQFTVLVLSTGYAQVGLV